jgi:thymidylate synthase (FAD)
MKIDVLDHGYVEFIEDWGYGKASLPEAGIIEAARMSTGKGFYSWETYSKCGKCGVLFSELGSSLDKTVLPNVCCLFKDNWVSVPGDKKLLAFLYTKQHMTPFEMAGMTIEIGAPIMVFREWHRHRTQSYNEMSARYIPLPDVNYVPSNQRLMASQVSTTNKQAQGTSGFEVTEESLRADRDFLQFYYDEGQKLYDHLLARGWPKELARLPVTVGRYSRMRASGNLRNWLAFLTLRMDPQAQWEIRQFARAVGQIVAARFPKTWELFVTGKAFEI